MQNIRHKGLNEISNKKCFRNPPYHTGLLHVISVAIMPIVEPMINAAKMKIAADMKSQSSSILFIILSIIGISLMSINIAYPQSREQRNVMNMDHKRLDQWVKAALLVKLNYECNPLKVKINGIDYDGVLHMAVLCSEGEDYAIYLWGDGKYKGVIQATTCRLYKAIEGRECWK